MGGRTSSGVRDSASGRHRAVGESSGLGHYLLFRHLMAPDVRRRRRLPSKGHQPGCLRHGHPMCLHLRRLDDPVGTQLHHRNVPLGLGGGTDRDSRKRRSAGRNGQFDDCRHFGGAFCSQRVLDSAAALHHRFRWALLLSLALWPLAPYTPILQALSASFARLADLGAAFWSGAATPGRSPNNLEFAIAYDGVMTSLERSRSIWGAFRARRAGPTVRSMRLLALIEQLDDVARTLVTLREELNLRRTGEMVR